MTALSSSIDSNRLRRVLGSFATGVTIVTTRSAGGRPVGLTANSFSSVSLSPPLVLWSLRRDSSAMESFVTARHWAVHVLSAEQQSLSDRFARRSEDRFAELEIGHGEGGVPLLSDCAAVLQCCTVAQHLAGDHVIFIGEVLACEHREAQPLVFHAGRYAQLAPTLCEA
ncbi:MAG: flavin reductase family protein [Curvibacter lanceolatus]|jgi:3-hydroxy-9,10-secoandrosta-1,3,5(10)-triene-9,17-dione monooxygenase reductase component|uniref:flavin reductase family protein n=1 Tax=Curvibacter lanceolatus TaxID=86182 RepID=UPI00035E6353|nr:flavin reductase family protein [Curvibacter lanceolatus]MBV5291995.1 flavin reductase family protein [Curvibacter lanceolatus]